MKITKEQLKQIIKEELETSLDEGFMASVGSKLMSMLSDETANKVLDIALGTMLMSDGRRGLPKRWEALTINMIKQAANRKEIDLNGFVKDWMNTDLDHTALDKKYGDKILGL
jgi:hypothetical protein